MLYCLCQDNTSTLSFQRNFPWQLLTPWEAAFNIPNLCQELFWLNTWCVTGWAVQGVNCEGLEWPLGLRAGITEKEQLQDKCFPWANNPDFCIFFFFTHLAPQELWAKLWAEIGEEAGWDQLSGMFICSQIPAKAMFGVWSQESLGYQVCQWLVETSLIRRQVLVGGRQNGKWIKGKTSTGDVPKRTWPRRRENSVCTALKTFGVQVLSVFRASVSWGETTALNQRHISIFNYLFFAEPAQQLPQPCVKRAIKAQTRI